MSKNKVIGLALVACWAVLVVFGTALSLDWLQFFQELGLISYWAWFVVWVVDIIIASLLLRAAMVFNARIGVSDDN